MMFSAKWVQWIKRAKMIPDVMVLYSRNKCENKKHKIRVMIIHYTDFTGAVLCVALYVDMV